MVSGVHKLLQLFKDYLSSLPIFIISFYFVTAQPSGHFVFILNPLKLKWENDITEYANKHHTVCCEKCVIPSNCYEITGNYFWCSLHASFVLKKSGSVELCTPSENQEAVTVNISGTVCGLFCCLLFLYCQQK